MTTDRSSKTRLALGFLAVAALGTAGLGILAEQSLAQQPTEAAATGAQGPAALLSVADIERTVSAEGLEVTDIELRERVAEVEGWDSSGREVEWIVDRRDGRVLSRDLDD